jgi:hypothetical protein
MSVSPDTSLDGSHRLSSPPETGASISIKRFEGTRRSVVGVRLTRAQASAFTLAHSTSTPGGVLVTRYVRSGEVRTGAFDE